MTFNSENVLLSAFQSCFCPFRGETGLCLPPGVNPTTGKETSENVKCAYSGRLQLTQMHSAGQLSLKAARRRSGCLQSLTLFRLKT